VPLRTYQEQVRRRIACNSKLGSTSSSRSSTLHDKTVVVTRCGRICPGKKKINFSTVFAGQAVGIKEVHDDIWLVSFMDYDLGYFDLETRVLEPLENPFGPKVLRMC
jgi:putative transposase